VGVATTKHLAKVASAAAKPDGLVIVQPGAEVQFLHPLPIDVLWGVGPVTAGKLRAGSIGTVGDIARADPTELEMLVGVGAARHLQALARNQDPRRVAGGRRRRSIGSQSSFPRSRLDRSDCDAVLLSVVDRVCGRMRRAERVGRTVVLRIRFGDFTQITRSHTLDEATNTTTVVLAPALDLFEGVWFEAQRRGLTRIGLSVTNLASSDALQLALPFIPGESLALDATIDAIHERFGSGSVQRVSMLGRRSINVPMLPD
jgi:DNA polymerase IV